MKKLYPYNKFISESVRDQMKPKSEEDIRNSLGKLTLDDKLIMGAREGWDAYMAQGDIKVEFLGLAGCPDEFTVPPLVTMALFRRIE